MIISHEYKYLFVEVPTTGSTAISAELRKYYGGESVLYKHANYSEFRHLTDSRSNEYFVFAGVRNPLDSIVSHYLRLKRNHRGVYTNPRLHATNGGWIPDSHIQKFKQIRSRNLSFIDFFKQFYDSVYHEWVLLCHKKFDFVIRFEGLQRDFAEVLNLIGVNQVRPLPVVNQTGRIRHFTEFYTPDIYEQAARIVGPFMRKWGYEFPERWGTINVPLSSRLRFEAAETFTNVAAGLVPLSPKSPSLQRVKRLLRTVGLA